MTAAVDFLAYALSVVRHALRKGLLTAWAFLKLGLFLGDVLTASEFGLGHLEFAAYLFGLLGYVVAAVLLTGRGGSGKESRGSPIYNSA